MTDSEPDGTVVVRIATRASRLALWQAHHVAELLRLSEPGVIVELVEVSTEGDRDRVRRLDAMGGTGVFTREVQQAVLNGEADLAVHSLKDLPTVAIDGLVLAGVPGRAESGDAVVVSQPVASPEALDGGLETIGVGARVGTGSPRRQAQIRHRRPDLEVAGIRGNVETRLRKLDEGEFDAVVLAVAGLDRLELSDRITAVLDPEIVLPAVGQGALGLECRDNDPATIGRLEAISDPAARRATLAERAMLARLRAGCHAPVGVRSGETDGRLWLHGVVLDPGGTQRVESRSEMEAGTGDAAESLGVAVADELLAAGAAELISG